MDRRIAAIYARVSTDDQSTELQLRDLRQYAKQRGFTIYAEFEDRVSGAIDKRPALDSLMNAARKRLFDAVLVWRFDRFARSTKHLVSALYEFRNLGIDFISFNENLDTGSPLGEAVFTIVAALSQLERDIIRQRVKAGLRNARAKGRQLGRRKTRDDHAIWKLRNEGQSLREIASNLQVSKSAVQRALRVSKTSQKTQA